MTEEKKEQIGKLKTLRDFEVNPKSWAGAMANAGRKYTIEISDLKQEAIKWVKKLDFCCNSEGFACEEEIQKWIKHFFNIEEKDLK